MLRGLRALQVDNHIAELTVRETLDFAARVLGVGHKEGAQLGRPLCHLPPCVPGCPHQTGYPATALLQASYCLCDALVRQRGPERDDADHESLLTGLCHRQTGVGLRAEYLRLLREKEKAAGLSGDDDIDAFLKASALQGKRHSVVTEYILKLLGLDVSAPSLQKHDLLSWCTSFHV